MCDNRPRGSTLFIVLLLLGTISLARGSDQPQNLKIDDPKLSSEKRQEYPVIYGKEGDGWPETMTVRGVITEVSPVPFDCGIFCGGTRGHPSQLIAVI